MTQILMFGFCYKLYDLPKVNGKTREGGSASRASASPVVSGSESGEM